MGHQSNGSGWSAWESIANQRLFLQKPLPSNIPKQSHPATLGTSHTCSLSSLERKFYQGAGGADGEERVAAISLGHAGNLTSRNEQLKGSQGILTIIGTTVREGCGKTTVSVILNSNLWLQKHCLK